MLTEEFKKLDITNVASGAAAELFDHAMGEVLANVMDENRDPLEVRKVTLTFEIKSNKERNMASVAVQASTKLAAVVKADSTMFFRNEKGRPVAYAHNIFQPELFKKDENVTPLRGQEAASRNNE